MLIGTLFPLLYFLSQLNQHHFRAVIEAERETAVADASAHHHIRIVFREQAGIVLGKKSLSWTIQPADKGQTELAAVGMSGEGQVDPLALHIPGVILRVMAHQQAELRPLRHFRHAVPESVNSLIDERKRIHPGITKMGSDMSVPNGRLLDVKSP